MRTTRKPGYSVPSLLLKYDEPRVLLWQAAKTCQPHCKQKRQAVSCLSQGTHFTCALVGHTIWIAPAAGSPRDSPDPVLPADRLSASSAMTVLDKVCTDSSRE